jgi:hypothetical protein
MKLYKSYLREFFGSKNKVNGSEICKNVYEKHNRELQINLKNCENVKGNGTEYELRKRICQRKSDALFCLRTIEELKSRLNECKTDKKCLEVINNYIYHLNRELKDRDEWIAKLEKALKNYLKSNQTGVR